MAHVDVNCVCPLGDRLNPRLLCIVTRRATTADAVAVENIIKKREFMVPTEVQPID